jgi:hypothetical protein
MFVCMDYGRKPRSLEFARRGRVGKGVITCYKDLLYERVVGGGGG